MTDWIKEAWEKAQSIPEVQTESEKIAYCKGWWDALEARRKEEEMKNWVCPESGDMYEKGTGHCPDCGVTLVPLEQELSEAEQIHELLWALRKIAAETDDEHSSETALAAIAKAEGTPSDQGVTHEDPAVRRV